ncbi:MAG: hypothetical protein M3014_09025 [Chloroflexota bacterium]|nr:hypothetical protein [Chloroflexota bacterium]
MQQETHVQHTTTVIPQPADLAVTETTTTTTTPVVPAVGVPNSVNVNTADAGQQVNVVTQPGVTSVNINEG